MTHSLGIVESVCLIFLTKESVGIFFAFLPRCEAEEDSDTNGWENEPSNYCTSCTDDNHANLH